jgi:hypothetical protein
LSFYVDEFHHHHGLADTGPTEHGRFAPLRQRSEQVDDLDAGFEYSGGGTAISKRWGASVDGGAW